VTHRYLVFMQISGGLGGATGESKGLSGRSDSSDYQVVWGCAEAAQTEISAYQKMQGGVRRTDCECDRG
jgi:hypothetical protein